MRYPVLVGMLNLKSWYCFEKDWGPVMSTWHSLTRLTWLIHTLFLPSNWNLDKIFALTGELGQVHMGKKYFWNSSMRKPFFSNSFYLLVLKKITNSVIKITVFPHGGKSEIFLLPYVLDLIHLLEQNFCPDSNLRVKTMYESVK